MNPDGMREQLVTSIREKITEHGCTVLGVGADPEGHTPQFSYTIGVFHQRGYEFAMSGASIAAMHYTLNEVARRALDGKLTPIDGLLIEGVLEDGYLLRLREAHPSWQEFGWMAPALHLVSQPKVWQVQFPARGGQFPGQPGYDIDPRGQLDYTQPQEP
jgi:hypothetical protein